MTKDLLTRLLASNPVVPPITTVSGWWQQYLELDIAWPSRIELAIAGGFAADRVGWAFATAYQAALRAMVPTLPAHAVVALCVTETQGTAPRAMQSTLTADGHGGLLLDGAKRWATLGPGGGLFLVAARDTREAGERPQIRLVAVPADAPGVYVQTMPTTSFVPEVPHAQLRFDKVQIAASDLLPGDGYSRYVKPFRTIEDLHVHAAVLSYLLRESRRLDWPREWTARAVSALLTFRAVAELDPTVAQTHIALAGTMATAEQLVTETDTHWAAAPDTHAKSRWQRDRRLLTLAAHPRSERILKAWNTLSPGKAE